MPAALADRPWDLIISDFALPQFNAHEALTLRRELAVDLPFLIVSGTIQEDEAVEALREGADAFITKGRVARLGPAVGRRLRANEEVQDRPAPEAHVPEALP